MGRHTLFLCIVLLLVILMAGCKTKKEEKREAVISEGVVNYSVNYTRDIEKRSYSFLLPDKMDYYFRPGQERISFTGNMGLYLLEFISNHVSDSTTTLLKILNNKMYVPPSESEKLFIFKNLDDSEVVFQEDTVRDILGYEARMASIHIEGEDHADIIIWYTPEIFTKSTNKNTPFSKIPGVMLEFSIYYNEVLFKLKATEIQKKNLSESMFDIPEGYKSTTIREVEEMIMGIIK